ncbi:hypothetical protein QV65_26000 [Rhodococcus erythropolis]|nr:hypothetical protein QV65_26000 [Rhodococcus erythropolis]
MSEGMHSVTVRLASFLQHVWHRWRMYLVPPSLHPMPGNGTDEMSLHMPRFFPVGDGRESRLPRRATAVLAALPAALLLATSGALLAPGSAAAAPGDDITDQCLEMSQNGGPWVKPAAFDPSGTDYIPIPGDEARSWPSTFVMSATFLPRSLFSVRAGPSRAAALRQCGAKSTARSASSS